MIGTMEQSEVESQDMEVVTPTSKPAKKMAQVLSSTPSITNFFKPSAKPSPPNVDVKPSDLRNYFQITSTKDSSKTSTNNGPDLEEGVICVEKTTTKKTETHQNKSRGDEKSGDKGNVKRKGSEKKERRGKKDGDTVKSSKKRKKQKEDGDQSSEEDFESPPRARRKRKSRLDSDSLPDMTENESGKAVGIPQEDTASDNLDGNPPTSKNDPSLCNGEDTDDVLNGSTVVSYEDFLNASMEDAEGCDGEKNIDDKGDTSSLRPDGKLDRGIVGSPMGNQGVPQETLDSVMLTPPDSRCSQVMSDADQTPTKDATSQPESDRKDDVSKVRKGEKGKHLPENDEPPGKGATDRELSGKGVEAEEDLPPRKVITIKAQVHSPFDRKDRDVPANARKQVVSSPSTSPMMSSSDSLQKESEIRPRRIITNVCVPDSSPELTTISILEKRDEEKKSVGPVYSIFQKKSVTVKKETPKEEKPEPSKDVSEEIVKDSSQELSTESSKEISMEKVEKDRKATDGQSIEKQSGEFSDTTEASVKKDILEIEKQHVPKSEEETKSDHHSEKSQTRAIKKTENEELVRETKEVQNTEGEKGSKNSKVRRVLLKPEKHEERPSNPAKSERSPEVTRRVLRTRVAKKPDEGAATLADLDASMDEFEDAKPLTTKATNTRKKLQKNEKSKVRATPNKETKAKSNGPRKASGSGNVTPKKFTSSLVTGTKGQGPIKLKLTAIKASPKKSTRVTKAQQLLQKAKKGHQVTMAAKAQPKVQSKLLMTKKTNQTKFGGQGNGSTLVSKNKTTGSGKEKGKAEAKSVAKGKQIGVATKKGFTEKETGKKINGATKPTSPGNRRRSSSRLKSKTPPKPAAKLAPIFTKQGQLAAAKKFRQDSLLASMATTDSILPLDESSRDSSCCSRDGFASGEPAPSSQMPTLGFNMLERLKAGSETMTTEGPCFMPIPEVSHILQKDEADSNWHLPLPSFSRWKMASQFDISRIPWRQPTSPIQLGSLTYSKAPPIGSFDFKGFSGHPPLSESNQKRVIEEILRASERFPARRVFKLYQAKKTGEAVKKDEGKLENTAEQNTGTAKVEKDTRLPRGKRKADEVAATGEEEEGGSRRKMARTEGRQRPTRRSLEAGMSGPQRGSKGEGEQERKGEEETGGRSLRRSNRRQSRRLDVKDAEEEESGACEEQKVKKGPQEKKGEEVERDGEKGKATREDVALNPADDQAARRRAGMPWTEKYQPSAASQMIGNTAVCKKFNSWLTDWKKKTQRMKEKTIRGQKKQLKKSKGSKKGESEDDDDSDDDFFCSDDEDSDEEDGLCNTVLLVGPHGVGKTALVYACAQELGFEVFEVNPSSRRNGRQILSELREVTQSHQVAWQHGVSSANFFKPSPTKSTAKNASPKKKKPAIPKAFAAFFKAGNADKKGKGSPTKRSPVKKPRSPKKQVKKPTQGASGKPSQSASGKAFAGFLASAKDKSNTAPKITSTSLILFDEADVVFEEDKGFLAAITSFMEKTKRPIVLTTTDPRFAYTLPGRYDDLSLKHPPLTPLTNHLQLICLAENVPTMHRDMKNVVQLLGRDVRKCLQNLQFWALSGAMPHGTSLEPSATCATKTQVKTNLHDKCLSKENAMDITEQNSQGDLADGRIQDCVSTTGPVADSQNVPCDLNRTEGEGAKCNCSAGCQKCEKDLRISVDSVAAQGKDKRVATTGSCATHRGMLESIVGLGNVAGPVTDVLQLLKHFDTPDMDSISKSAVIGAFHKLGLDIAHHNIPHLLNMCRVTQDKASKVLLTRQESICGTSEEKVEQERTSEMLTAKEASESSTNDTNDECEQMEESKQEMNPSEVNAKDELEKMASRLGRDLIHAFADHSETMSALDTRLPHSRRQRARLERYSNQEWWQPLSFPGLDDSEDNVGSDWELFDVRPYGDLCESVVEDINGWTEAASLTRCIRSWRRTVDVARGCSSDEETLSRAVDKVLLPRGGGPLHLQQSDPGTNIRDTHHTVVTKLPDYQYCNHPALALDYLPTLRGICRSEELRREANLKRRFFHYLDSISLCLKPATFLSLASMLNQEKSPP